MEPEEFSRVIGQYLGSFPYTMDERDKINDAMGKANSIEDMPADIQALLAKAHPTESRSIESRALVPSKIERRIVKKPNICKQCADNNDPNKVPVHPHCDCDVVTDSIQTGIGDATSRFFQQLNNTNMDIEVIDGSKFDGDLYMDPATAALLDAENVRFSDIARWLEAMEPYLNRLDLAYQYVGIAVDDDTQEAVDQVKETIENLSDDSEDLVEAIKNRKLWFALAKAVAI